MYYGLDLFAVVNDRRNGVHKKKLDDIFDCGVLANGETAGSSLEMSNKFTIGLTKQIES